MNYVEFVQQAQVGDGADLVLALTVTVKSSGEPVNKLTISRGIVLVV
jgi:hypothetical protein